MPRGDILQRVAGDIDRANTVDEYAALAADTTLVAAAGFSTLATITFTLTAVKTIVFTAAASGQFGAGATLGLVIRIDGVDVKGGDFGNGSAGTVRGGITVLHSASLAVGTHTILLRGQCTGALVVQIDAASAPTTDFASIIAREQL